MSRPSYLAGLCVVALAAATTPAFAAPAREASHVVVTNSTADPVPTQIVGTPTVQIAGGGTGGPSPHQQALILRMDPTDPSAGVADHLQDCLTIDPPDGKVFRIDRMLVSVFGTSDPGARIEVHYANPGGDGPGNDFFRYNRQITFDGSAQTEVEGLPVIAHDGADGRVELCANGQSGGTFHILAVGEVSPE